MGTEPDHGPLQPTLAGRPAVWFLDIHDKRIKTADLDSRVETMVELPFIPNALGFRRDGSLLVLPTTLFEERHVLKLKWTPWARNG